MCGIFGNYRWSSDWARDFVAPYSDSLKRSTTTLGLALAHRGPDGTGSTGGGNWGIGNNRLSIIDLEGGTQPLWNSDRSLVVVQNGEIYNFVELAEELRREGAVFRTRSDTEVLLHAYERWGPDFVTRLNGMFAIALADFRARSLHLYRDRFGEKPLFIHTQGDQVAFASEIKAFRKAGMPLTLDPGAIRDYLTFNYVTPPWTVFREVQSLEPGTRRTINASGTSEARWWNFDQEVSRRGPASGDEVRSLVTDAVRIRMRADVPVGTFLSGGIDSSLVMSLAAEHSPLGHQAFSVVFPGTRYDENEASAAVAKKLGVPRVTVTGDPSILDSWGQLLGALDQPHGDPSFLYVRLLSRLAHGQVKVALTGDGADEVFGGYDRLWRGEYAEKGTAAAYFNTVSMFPPVLRNEVLGRGLQFSRPAPELEFEERFQASADWLGSDTASSRTKRALRYDVLWLLQGNNLVKPDRMGMLESVELRSPFLDHRLIVAAMRLEGTELVRKRILRDLVTERLGEAVAATPKKQFTVPILEWNRAWIERELGRVQRGKAVELGLLDSRGVEAFAQAALKQMDTYYRAARALVGLELWLENAMDQ